MIRERTRLAIPPRDMDEVNQANVRCCRRFRQREVGVDMIGKECVCVVLVEDEPS